MIIGNKLPKAISFKVIINHNVIPQINNVKYFGVILNDKLSWQPHIDHIIKKLSRACVMIFKFRPYVPLSTLKLIYFSIFHSVIQYSLINWNGRRASKNLIHKKILQNRFLCASLLFHTVRTPVNLLYTEFGVLKLEDVIDMEYAKFLFRFCNNMLPLYFNNHFKSLEIVHHHNTRQKNKKYFSTLMFERNGGEK